MISGFMGNRRRIAAVQQRASQLHLPAKRNARGEQSATRGN